MAGDAAGTCHPISGAGIYNALISGEMAGIAAAEALKENSMRPLRTYAMELTSFLGPSLASAFVKRRKMVNQWQSADFMDLIKHNWIAFAEYRRKTGERQNTTTALQESCLLSSPEHLQMSLAAAMTLGLKQGIFYRNARLYCLNLLLTYPDGCRANCSYCGLQKSRDGDFHEKSFIRVQWPTYDVKTIIDKTLEANAFGGVYFTGHPSEGSGRYLLLTGRFHGRWDCDISPMTPTIMTKTPV
jgi:hypothetical protein